MEEKKATEMTRMPATKCTYLKLEVRAFMKAKYSLLKKLDFENGNICVKLNSKIN